jgi:glycosyltransferase involved in cell wall biosynthesis
VIATDVGGNAEAVVHGQGGLIVEPEKSDALAGAIIELAKNRGGLEAMGRFNRERVVERFSLDASARNLADWYFERASAVGPGSLGAHALH